MTASLNPGSNVLISGVTGLIGGELFRGLADRLASGRLWAVVRPGERGDADARLRGRLLRSGDGRELGPNVRAVPGDILERDWGMSGPDRRDVVGRVDVIVHSAADTSFAAKRSTSRTNVAGVESLIGLARSCPRPPLVVYVSTAANVGAVNGRCLTEDEGCRPDGHHHNDYTHSKAVGERMLRESGLPLLVLRPSIVLSAGLPDAKFARQILWCAPLTRAFKALPLDPAARQDVVDVAFVAAATLRLLERPALAFDTYNLSAGAGGATTLACVAELTGETYGRATPLGTIPPAEWGRAEQAKYVRTAVQRRVFRSLRTYLPFFNMDVVYDDSRLRAELGAAAPLVRPVERYLPGLLRLIGTRAALREAAVP